MIPRFIDNILSRLTEPSTAISTAGILGVFVWASENRDFIEYLEQKPIVAVILLLLAFGVGLKEKGNTND